MTFDDWMRARNPKYCPTDDTVALRELRDCWRAAEYHSERAQEREMMIELMRDKCRKVGDGGTATLGHNVEVQRDSGSIIAGGSAGTTGSAAGDDK